jgi:cystathionine gamma-lyase
VAVDNTTITMLGQQPLALGADFCVCSDTKAMSGHSDLLLGHVAARDPAWAETIRTWRMRTGAIPGPMEVWLAHRSLATLQLRLERMCVNAQRIAEFLQERPEVVRVLYPGLPSDASHAVAKRQMQYFGSIVSFELKSRAAAEAFLQACRIVIEATSFGGVHSSAERRARWGSEVISESFIRLSAGCEHPDDLIADLSQALEKATAPRRSVARPESPG